MVRTRTRASDGTVSLVLLCDPATAAVLDACRHHVLTGAVQSADERYLVVRPSAGGVPVTLRVTPKTLYRNSGADVPASAFPAGAAVAVVCRGLPSGLLMAAVVSDRGADAVQERVILRPVVVSGTLAAVEPDRGLLVIAPRGKPRRTVAVGESTHVKVRKTEATLRDLTRGMHVTARLGPGKDAAGHPVALSLSAYDVGAVRKR